MSNLKVSIINFVTQTFLPNFSQISKFKSCGSSDYKMGIKIAVSNYEHEFL